MGNILRMEDIDLKSANVVNMNMFMYFDLRNITDWTSKRLHEKMEERKVDNLWNDMDTNFDEYTLCVNVVDGKITYTILGNFSCMDDKAFEDAVSIEVDSPEYDELFQALTLYQIGKLFIDNNG